MEESTRNGLRSRTYRVVFGTAPQRMIYGLDAEGKIAGILIRPE